MTNFFGKIKGRFKAFFSKEYLSYSAHKYKAFTALQMKEAFGKERSANPTRDRIISIVGPLIKFIAVFGITFGLLFLNVLFGFINKLSFYYFFVFFTAIIFVLQLITTTASCTKSYYIAEDNKILITFPSSGASLFLSKLTVEFFRELKQVVDIYLPVAMAIIVYTVFFNKLDAFPAISIIWVIIPTLIFAVTILLLGSLLSVLYLQYLRITKTFPVIRLVVLAILFGFVVFLAVKVINLIPPDINLRLMWTNMKDGIDDFLKTFTKYAYPVDFFCSSIIGFRGTSYMGYKLNGISFARFFILVAIVIVLFVLVFFVIKKMFLHMMTKSVDYEKVLEHVQHPNHVHHKHTTFAFKELKISLRTLSISGTYIVTYVLIPVLILLLARIFNAINTSMRGNMLSIMFIMLLIVLPLLASNTPLSSAYSREGHAGYIKKTKPIRPYTPMISKLLFNLVLSVPSIFVSMFIVARFGKIDMASTILLGISVLFLQYGHIFYSSTLDFSKPKNEEYQTEGQGAKNPNENTATVVAFVMAFLFAFLIFFFFNEQVKLKSETFIKAAVRIFIVCFATFASMLTLYLLKLKAFFLER